MYLQNFDLRVIFTGNMNVMRLYGADIRALGMHNAIL